MVSFTYKIGNKKNNSGDDLFNRLYVFSDSLSDPGNVFNTTRAADNILSSIDPSLAGLVPIEPPVPPYDSQGKITNGNPEDPNRSIWVDFLADELNLDSPIVASSSLTVVPDPSFVPPDPSVAPPAALFNINTFLVEANFNYGGQTANQSVNFAFAGATSGEDNVSNLEPIPPNPPIPGLNSNIPGVLKQIDSFIVDVADDDGNLPPNQTAALGDAL